jgi:hypothetical protein
LISLAAGAAFREGKVRLADFVGERESRQWGTTRYTLSLKEASARADNRAVSRQGSNRMDQSFHAKTEADRPFAQQLTAVIESVHGVQGIISVPIERSPLPHDWTGQFDPYTRTVSVSPNAPLPLTTGVHEIGHAIDALFLVAASKLGRLEGPISLYTSQYALQGRGLLVDWYQEIKRSRPFTELAQSLSGTGFMSDAWNEAQYWLLPMELWARAYEQFIAENTDDADLQAQFRQKRLDEASIGDRKIKVYWTTEESQRISLEIKRLLESLGWM